MQTPRQTFIKTSPTVLTYGMCGGPCLSRTTIPTTPNNNAVDAVVCGLLEGIVPMDHPEVELRGLGSIVSQSNIVGFLKDIEGGMDRMTAQGHVLLQVGGWGMNKMYCIVLTLFRTLLSILRITHIRSNAHNTPSHHS